MIRLALALALLVLAVPALALAEPARIRVFEAAARAEPAKDAPVLQVLPENAEVSVSEQATGGWRRVRLQDGRVGWIEESALAFPSAAGQATPTVTAAAGAAAIAPASVPASPSPDLHARIYVKDLGHLAELVKEDPTVSPMAAKLASRRKAAIGVGIVGGLASVIAIGAGVARVNDQVSDPADPDFMKDDGGEKLFIAGAVGALATALTALAIYPGRGDVLDVVNAWNGAHPDRPFEIQSGEVGHHH